MIVLIWGGRRKRKRRTAATPTTVFWSYYVSGICSDNLTWTQTILTTLWKVIPSLIDGETETLKGGVAHSLMGWRYRVRICLMANRLKFMILETGLFELD